MPRPIVTPSFLWDSLCFRNNCPSSMAFYFLCQSLDILDISMKSGRTARFRNLARCLQGDHLYNFTGLGVGVVCALVGCRSTALPPYHICTPPRTRHRGLLPMIFPAFYSGRLSPCCRAREITTQLLPSLGLSQRCARRGARSVHLFCNNLAPPRKVFVGSCWRHCWLAMACARAPLLAHLRDSLSVHGDFFAPRRGHVRVL